MEKGFYHQSRDLKGCVFVTLLNYWSLVSCFGVYGVAGFGLRVSECVIALTLVIYFVKDPLSVFSKVKSLVSIS